MSQNRSSMESFRRFPVERVAKACQAGLDTPGSLSFLGQSFSTISFCSCIM